MTNNLEREQLIDLFKKAQFTDDYTKGQIQVDSSSLVQNLTLAFEQAEKTGWQVTSLSTISLHQTYSFYFDGVQSSQFGYFFKTIEQLCNHTYCRAAKGKKYYIIDLQYDYKDTQKPLLIQNYERLLMLVDVLKKTAAFVDSSNSKMLFLHGDKLEIEPIYTKNELEQLDIEHLDSIIEFINENTHESQKLAILGKAIINLCKNEAYDKRFKYFLAHLKNVYETLDHDYAVFSSNFSYEKLHNEIENAKLEEHVKIHKVITDIQNQILGIPVATVIVATQFKTKNTVNDDFMYQFAVNSGITIGVIIFTLIMWFLVKNQKESLIGLKVEIQRKDAKFKTDTKVIYDRIVSSTGQKPFQTLFDRINTQEMVLCAIKWLCVIACVATIVIYLNITVNPFSA